MLYRHGFLRRLAPVLVAAAAGAAEPPAEITLGPADRVLVLAPHPDDEVLGCGGVLRRAADLRLAARVVFLTYGDNNEWSFAVYRRHPVVFPSALKAMGETRRSEAVCAAGALGFGLRDLVFLGYPDFGTLDIWCKHWGQEPPARSLLSHATAVPYPDAFRPGAPYKGEDILRDLTGILRDFRPTKLFVSHPADHNPDHRALYLFTSVALEDAGVRPEVHPYLVHFRAWPRPRGFHGNLGAVPPPTLSNALPWRAFALSAAEVGEKQRALGMHRSQVEYSGAYLQSFVRTNELFGDYGPLRFAAEDAGQAAAGEAGATGGEEQPFLNAEEKAAFVGIERRRIELTSSQLVVTVSFSRPLAAATELSVYAMGWRRDVAFAAMPKLHVKVSTLGERAYDQSRALPAAACRIARTAREIEVAIPLRQLNDPARIYTSVRTYIGELPLDWTAWRLVEPDTGSPDTGSALKN